LENSSPKKKERPVPERGRLARKRGDALKSVEAEINFGFNLNVI
jgi:flagellar biosynthesis protein FlhB